jgi:putative hydrolase of the HAD superfamily
VVKAVLLDVGGVLLLPHGDPVGQAMASASIAYDETQLERAHYVGVHAVDEFDGSDWDPDRYLRAYIGALGVVPEALPTALETLWPVWADPAVRLWRHRVVDSIEAMSLLAASGVPLAIVSNSDGTVEQELRVHRVCQVGPGDGVEVVSVTDSTVVGVSKPDPAVFGAALAALGIEPADGVYVGDTERYDVRGAARAGLQPVHFDPFRLCRHPNEHRHITSLRQLLPDDGDAEAVA